MRQVVLDTETTGLSTDYGHRIIEIGCVEIIDRRMTGNHYHCYLQPQREIDAGALAVHGISNEFLQDKPRFHQIFDEFLGFINGAELIIHNAPFDVGFINYEFKLIKHEKTVNEYCTVFDSLMFARQRHPGQKNSLDALCRRYEIDNTHRQLHGALLDADLLARLYLAMTGGQGSLFADPQATQDEQIEVMNLLSREKELPVSQVSDAEEQAHLEFLEILNRQGGANLWEESDS